MSPTETFEFSQIDEETEFSWSRPALLLIDKYKLEPRRMPTFNFDEPVKPYEIVADGDTQKRKVYYDRDIYFIKMSSYQLELPDGNFANGLESYAEVLGSLICDYLGIPAIRYSFCFIRFEGVTHVGCMSPSFKIEGYEDFVTLHKLLAATNKFGVTSGDGGKITELGCRAFEPCCEYLQSFTGVDFHAGFYEMILLDYIIGNGDRHLGNYGVIRTAAGTMRPMRLFDFGDGFFCTVPDDLCTMDNFEIIEQMAITLPFSSCMEDQLQLIPREWLKSRLDRLARLRDEFGDILLSLEMGLDQQRIDCMLELVETRIDSILEVFY